MSATQTQRSGPSNEVPEVVSLGALVIAGIVATSTSATPRIALGLTAGLLVIVSVIDLRERRIPNAWVLRGGVVILAAVVIAGLVAEEVDRLLVALTVAAATFGLFFAAALAYPPGLGMGDVKLIGLVALPLGWFGAGAVLVVCLLAFLATGVVGLLAKARGVWVDGVPFGPFLTGAYLLTIGLGVVL